MRRLLVKGWLSPLILGCDLTWLNVLLLVLWHAAEVCLLRIKLLLLLSNELLLLLDLLLNHCCISVSTEGRETIIKVHLRGTVEPHSVVVNWVIA